MIQIFVKVFQLIGLSFLVFLFSPVHLQGQTNYTISGYVKDASTGETLIGANVVTNDASVGTTTNLYVDIEGDAIEESVAAKLI